MDKDQAAGNYTAHWDGKDDQGNALASGIYVYRLEAGSYVASNKLALVR